MRKLVLLLLCAIFVIRQVYAAEIDLSGYSVEELLALQDKVDSALFEKGGLTVIELGTYTVGVDIAAGSYVLKPYPSDKAGLGVLNYTVYRNEKSESKYEAAQNKYNTDYKNAKAAEEAGQVPEWPREINEKKFIAEEGRIDSEANESGKVNLKDGQVLVLTSTWGAVTVTIKKAGGLFME